MKVLSPTLLLIVGFTLSVMKSSLLTEGLTTSVLPNVLVLEPAEYGRRCLFIEIQLRNRLIAGDLDFCLLIVGCDNPGIGEKLSVRVLV